MRSCVLYAGREGRHLIILRRRIHNIDDCSRAVAARRTTRWDVVATQSSRRPGLWPRVRSGETLRCPRIAGISRPCRHGHSRGARLTGPASCRWPFPSIFLEDIDAPPAVAPSTTNNRRRVHKGSTGCANLEHTGVVSAPAVERRSNDGGRRAGSRAARAAGWVCSGAGCDDAVFVCEDDGLDAVA